MIKTPKKSYRKKRKVSHRKKRSGYHHSYIGKNVISYHPSTRRNSPLPERYRTRLWMDVDGIIPINSGNEGIGFCAMNSAYLPLATVSTWGTLDAPGTIAFGTITPAGYAYMMGNAVNSFPYRRCRVLGFGWSIRLSPGTDGAVELVTLPTNAAVSTPPNVFTMKSSPFSKSTMYNPNTSATNPNAGYIKNHVIEGTTRQAYESDLSNVYSHTYNTYPTATNYLYYGFKIFNTVATGAGVIGYRFEFHWDCEFYDLNNDRPQSLIA